MVFWVPRLVPESTEKTTDEQHANLAALRTRLELPEHHLSKFGSVALLAALVLAEFKRSGDRVPLNCYWVRTDTCDAGGDRLDLGDFGEVGLDCDYWHFGGKRAGDLGVFAWGVEALGS